MNLLVPIVVQGGPQDGKTVQVDAAALDEPSVIVDESAYEVARDNTGKPVALVWRDSGSHQHL
ncbi:hypothetical protein ACFQZ4_19220 [Catellatospora coxensis]|uniref:Uncharacterized protein n=1 Tax=Catellatospora coxensis TaxID=310354 RepID=A0A8J3L433_9ACTN|nr:hypothetical protein [Catellatospora coxensis]GIG08679.1 hypothetical protein Cco03nite_53790 [Catellatospora coxensis]